MVIRLTYVAVSVCKKDFLMLKTYIFCGLDLLTEITRREKDAGIFPDADVDLFMKVNLSNCSSTRLFP